VNVPTQTEQRRRLQALLNDTADWGVALYLQRPGDVSFLAPIVPELAGYEIVSATSDPDRYDVWRKGRLWRTNQSKAEISAWLARHTPDEKTLEKHVIRWTEAALNRYGIQKRSR
jgi:hypothetical protein